MSEGCSKETKPTEEKEDDDDEEEEEEEEEEEGAESKERGGFGRVLCADRCVKRGPYCTGGDKWSRSEEAKHVPLLPLYSSKII